MTVTIVTPRVTPSGCRRDRASTPLSWRTAGDGSVEIVTTHWARVENGRIAEVDHHIDLITMLAQVGALPG